MFRNLRAYLRAHSDRDIRAWIHDALTRLRERPEEQLAFRYDERTREVAVDPSYYRGRAAQIRVTDWRGFHRGLISCLSGFSADLEIAGTPHELCTLFTPGMHVVTIYYRPKGSVHDRGYSYDDCACEACCGDCLHD